MARAVHAFSICLFASVANLSIGVRPERVQLSGLTKTKLKSEVAFCGLEVFKALDGEATFGDAKAHFLSHCQDVAPQERCNAASAELWQGQDLDTKLASATDSGFCSTLRLVAAAWERGALSENAEMQVALGKAVSGKFLGFLFGSSNGNEAEPEPESEKEARAAPVDVQSKANSATQAWCQNGILNWKGDTCCAAECGKCGGKGCGKRPGGKPNCCRGKITATCSSQEEVACRLPEEKESCTSRCTMGFGGGVKCEGACKCGCEWCKNGKCVPSGGPHGLLEVDSVRDVEGERVA